MTEPLLYIKKVEGGYQLHKAGKDTIAETPVNDKVYFHPTSAYAALGRILHVEHVADLGYKTDPAKAPAKGDAK